MGRDTIQLDDVVSTISEEYLLEFTSEYGIPEDLHPELPGPEDTIVDFPEGKVGAPKDGMRPADSYSALDVTTLNTRRTPIQKQPELLLCLVGLSRRYFSGDDVYPTFLYDDDWEMDLFNLISAPNPAKVKTGTRPRAAHEVPLLTATTNRVIDMEDTTGESGSSETPSTVEKLPLEFAVEDLPLLNTEGVGTEEQIQDEVSHGVPPIRESSNHKGCSRAGSGAGGGCYRAPCTQKAPQERSSKKTIVAEDPDSERSTSFTSMGGSPGSVYQPGWGVTNSCRLDTPDADMKKAAEAKNAELMKELEGLRGYFSDLQLSNQQLSQQVSTLQAQITGEEKIKAAFEKFKKYEDCRITGEEKIKAAFEEFKKYEDVRVKQRCAEMDARLDALSIDFDEELYPHMLTVIAVDVEAYDPEANDKLVKALQDLKDLNYPMVDQMERLKDAPMELIMASLHLEGDTREDAP
ncbi:hypothetical protein Tco_0155932 [Tanacetum coccineum]